VYRNLTLLSDIGEIQRLRVGDGVDHFDADTSPHYHFYCSDCGSVMDLEMESIESINEKAKANFDGIIAGHVTYFYGTCNKCMKNFKTS
jgi:Fur family peroxide stress response transcriptional regulator